ncbi:MAG: hypothetical protein Q7K40_04655 [bacterium]|nr:hypothetical protein [bacterium]
MKDKASPKTKICVECGEINATHGVTYVDVLIKIIFGKVFSNLLFLEPTVFKMNSLIMSFEPHIFSALVRTGVAKKQTEPDHETQLLAQMLWAEAKARGIVVWELRLFRLARNFFLAEFKNGKRITFEGIPLPVKKSTGAWWIDDKAILKKEFQSRGLTVAKGGSVSSKKSALELFRKLDVPVIVKPRKGSGSRHTTLHITDEAELLRAFAVAKQVSPSVIIEEEIEGSVYRATVVDGKLVATLRRDPPCVVGDGTSTILELVRRANEHPARSGPYFSKIKLDDSATTELKWQGHVPKDILPKGRRVTFHQKVNWSVGGTTADVTEEVHADNIALFERTAEVLNAPIVGIDFIIADISRSWKDQERCGIIECNSMPFFDNHHLPFEGKPRNVAGAIWDMIETSQK